MREGDRFRAWKAQKASRYLNCTNEPETVALDIRIVGILFELNHLAIKFCQALSGFRQKFRKEIIHFQLHIFPWG